MPAIIIADILPASLRKVYQTFVLWLDIRSTIISNFCFYDPSRPITFNIYVYVLSNYRCVHLSSAKNSLTNSDLVITKTEWILMPITHYHIKFNCSLAVKKVDEVDLSRQSSHTTHPQPPTLTLLCYFSASLQPPLFSPHSNYHSNSTLS